MQEIYWDTYSNPRNIVYKSAKDVSKKCANCYREI